MCPLLHCLGTRCRGAVGRAYGPKYAERLTPSWARTCPHGSPAEAPFALPCTPLLPGDSLQVTDGASLPT